MSGSAFHLDGKVKSNDFLNSLAILISWDLSLEIDCHCSQPCDTIPLKSVEVQTSAV